MGERKEIIGALINSLIFWRYDKKWSKIKNRSSFLGYNNAISNPTIVKAAVGDATINPPLILPPDGLIAGGSISFDNYKSKYLSDSKPPYNLTGVHQQWSGVAYARVARALKYIRRAYGESAFPIALDSSNAAICSSLISNAFDHSKDDAPFCQQAIPLDQIIDPLSLDNELASMNWKEVLDLRKVILPKTETLRKELIKKAIKLSRIEGNNPSIYSKLLIEMESEFRKAHEELSKAWESLRVKGILTSGGAVGLIGLNQVIPGLNILISSQSIFQLLVNVISSSLVITSVLSREIKELLQCNNKVRNHPLFFIERLPSENK